MNKLAQLDHRYLWHPFTQMKDWLRTEPIVIVSGRGAVLRDAHGNEYLDANSSIWTNLHGHRHPKLNQAITRQLGKIAHSSALGLANEPASLLAERLVANSTLRTPHPALASPLSKVFFSDDGSTALEVALKLAYQFARRVRGMKTPAFLSLQGAYHGDTVGAVSLGHIDLFHAAYKGLLFKSDAVPSPYCYRCPFNRAKPERADARTYCKCSKGCVTQVEKAFERRTLRGEPYAAFIFEPLMQGAAGMIAQPAGWLRQVAAIARQYDAQLIADEVMTGFGRTGRSDGDRPPSPLHGERAGVRRGAAGDVQGKLAAPGLINPPLFASHHEGVQPDYLCVAKGLTGGYLPMAATLTTQKVFDAFLGEYHDFKAFFHGHSYTANQLGAAAGLASLDLLHTPASVLARHHLQQAFTNELASLWDLPNVGDIRQVGLIAGIELVREWTSRKEFHLRERVGIRVCEAMARRGVLTRPVGNVIVIMPPYCTTPRQTRRIIQVLRESVQEVLSDSHR